MEKLDPKEKAKKTIDHLLNDYDEYPDVLLTNEEKVDKANKRDTDPDFAEKYRQWQHNKYSITWWFTPMIPQADLMIAQLVPDSKKEYFYNKLDGLRKKVKEEGKSKITKETIEQANALLEELKRVI